MKKKLILIPSSLHESNGAKFLGKDTISEIYECKSFIVERAKTARQFLKSIEFPHSFDDVRMLELNKHGEDDIDEIFSLFDAGTVGLISDAGVPGVADPGGLIVRQAHAEGVDVRPLVGPSSLLLALMASGMNGQKFAFHGYLPKDEKELAQKLKSLERESKEADVTQMFIETPYRNSKMLKALFKILDGGTDLCIASNLTSPTQYIQTKTVGEWKQRIPDLGKNPTVFLVYGGKL
ncbi:MAG: SAM-dependent methyltransferase [Flavobacteriales bacterium]|jgi:16S rRNA (cytidine1402-2'-O)-methyltransferase|nr:SAM-dependent methyltransferase [Flavobacteriales bacterium]NCG30615.1 SAM-dependent methyltransferase [Bacteroidota bacterium]MBT3964032.1 SAM-dependent methyltransferase [Flavobacteriales bacterium]MBT4704504.1 SAM-dependent methyltransferase [Flavobacteriales bacterium]MBT4931259.1 SAM-dependent methyltransferase [Flavobacteriales bacterium]